ncbi:unnamed protein product [Clonostachys rhizophaga]|uniref:NB-ARC domain-containing protein n=1 Tax=Clonostachys rhizophaga TaxID=160324 RepID=A0A9N9VMJ0_9HYPO|nr:unnamed protein product [Clonostachys rhizophaga]
MSTVSRLGFTELGVKGRDGPFRYNVIFVHGLKGHPKHTWGRETTGGNTAHQRIDIGFNRKRASIRSLLKSGKTTSTALSEAGGQPKPFWPEEFLTRDLPDARIWTYGYNADVIQGMFRAGNQNSISQHGRDLSAQFERDVANKDPVVFIAHSLGGILIKSVIHLSEKCRSRTRLVIFLGTPHRGSRVADWGKIVSNLSRVALQQPNSRILRGLQVDSEVLENIHEEFKVHVHKCGFKIYSFQEGRAPETLGISHKIVDDFSSKMDLHRGLETIQSMDADHRQIAKCSNKEDPRYRAILGVLKQFVSEEIDCLAGEGISHIESKSSTASGKHPTDYTDGNANVQPIAQEAGPKPTLNPIYYLPFTANRKFTGRESVLQAIQKKLFSDPPCQRIALDGLGGVGKTQVALQFAHWMKTNHPTYSVFWIPVLSEASFEQAYMEIGKLLSVPRESDEDYKKTVQRYLSSETAGKWLLIIDNADDKTMIFGALGKPGLINFLPQSDHGLFLLTSRVREIAILFAETDVISIPEMNSHEARALLDKSVITREEGLDEHADQLLKELSYLPLGITQAAAYLNRNSNISPRRYLDLLRGAEIEKAQVLSRGFHDQRRYSGLSNDIMSTWLVSFSQIAKEDLFAFKLLSFIACIEPRAIPKIILPFGNSEEEMENAIGTLCGYSFLTQRHDPNTFDMHRLVHLATIRWLEGQGMMQGNLTNATQGIFENMAKQSATDQFLDHPEWRQILPHGVRLISQSEPLCSQDLCNLADYVGICLLTERRFKEVIDCLHKTASWARANLAWDNMLWRHLDFTLAHALLQEDRVDEAIEIIEPIVITNKETTKDDKELICHSEHLLASAYLENKRVDEAIEMFEAMHKNIGEDTSDFKFSYDQIGHQLASAYIEAGRAKEAIEILEPIVEENRRTSRQEDRDRLSSEHELGRAYLRDDRIHEAIEILEHVINVQKEHQKEDDRARLASEHELGLACRKAKRLKEAIEVLEHAVKFRKAELGEENHLALVSEHELALAYLEDGRVEESIKILKRLVRIRKETLEENDESRLASESALQRAYRQRKPFIVIFTNQVP